MTLAADALRALDELAASLETSRGGAVAYLLGKFATAPTKAQ